VSYLKVHKDSLPYVGFWKQGSSSVTARIVTTTHFQMMVRMLSSLGRVEN